MNLMRSTSVRRSVGLIYHKLRIEHKLLLRCTFDIQISPRQREGESRKYQIELSIHAHTHTHLQIVVVYMYVRSLYVYSIQYMMRNNQILINY